MSNNLEYMLTIGKGNKLWSKTGKYTRGIDEPGKK